MRIPRVYSPQPLSIGDCIELEAGAARHLTSVLRMTSGQPVCLFNGRGGEYSGELVEAKKGKASVAINHFADVDRESPLCIHLAIGISRGERMDWIMQKATELGVSEITPLFTERCEVKLSGDRLGKKVRHWQQVAISACEQSQRNSVPQINNPILLEQWQQHCEASLKLVLHHRSAKSLGEMSPPSGEIALLIGPEGGLSEREIEQATSFDFLPLAIGPRVLRTETAPLAAISILQSLWGDMS
ncbi:MAG: 16S rRNA (uracil(1498)-N(3))-methyltransferase [Porticoccaceae bacterium]|nr:16S rRNA (uracil(1498)-N(3))-methyltransferase [Porticoccaceae bacterium]